MGGAAEPDLLLEAYGHGIFPWPYDEEHPLYWHSPDPRFVLPLDEFRFPRSLRKVIRSGRFTFDFDRRFPDVMKGCQNRPNAWIVSQFLEGYGALHRRGWAHSTEAYHQGELVGGLYGIAIGKLFCGESMFFTQPEASKAAFVFLVAHLKHWGFELIDCQSYTDHLARFGARDRPRAEFLNLLSVLKRPPLQRGTWQPELDSDQVLTQFGF